MSEPKRWYVTLKDQIIATEKSVARWFDIPKRQRLDLVVRWEDYARLKAENERLIRAGNAMEMTLQADFNGCPYEPTIVREAMIYWRTAKQGGPQS